MPKTATLTRMELPQYICPYGVKARDLLTAQGYQINETILTTRDETDAFKAANNIATTPLIVIDGDVIGGYTDLRKWLRAQGGPTVTPPLTPTLTPPATPIISGTRMWIALLIVVIGAANYALG